MNFKPEQYDNEDREAELGDADSDEGGEAG
jgi:hypothetical protein